MKKGLFIIVMVLSMISLVACGSKDNERTDTGLDREDVDITMTITTGGSLDEGTGRFAGGTRQEVTKTFKTNPRVVAIFSYDALDILDYVGIENTSITHLGMPKNNLPVALQAYNTIAYENIGTLFIPNWDVLDLFMPDLIILGSRNNGAYDQLQQQYPYADILDVTMVNGFYKEGLIQNANNLAKIFPTVADEILETLDELILGMETVQDVAKDFNALFIMVNGESLSFYGPYGRFAMLHNEFGFNPADDRSEEGGSHGSVVGYEYVAKVNPEILFLLDRGVATGASGTTDAVKANALIQNTEAGKSDHIYVLDPAAWYLSTGGFNSTFQMIADLESFMTKVQPYKRIT